VGLLTSALLSPQVLAWDVLAHRREQAARWGARAERPAPASCDVVVELTGNPAALNEALEAVRFGGRLVLGSWYGARPVEVALGGDFHRSRIEMLSSQVSTLSPALSGRWTKRRRLETALGLIGELGPASLVTHRFPVAEAARAYEQVMRSLGLSLLTPSGVEAAMREITCPVQVIAGARDPLFGPATFAELARLRPDWECIELADIGHVPQLEAPREVTRHLLDWLGRVGCLRQPSPVAPSKEW